MTNIQIIENAKTKLVLEGFMKPDEDLHTYGHWKKLGYQVFRGEKAIINLNIWRNAAQAEDEDADGEKKEVKRPVMVHQRAAFFSTRQVFKLD